MNSFFIIAIVITIIVVGYFVFVQEKKENFYIPNFIQVFPRCGDSPLTVSFVPIYINESMNFIIDYGDDTKHISNSLNDVYGVEYTYKNPGTYNGSIVFRTDKNEPIREQQFTITVK